MDQSPKQDNFDEQTLDQLQDGQSLTFNEGLEQWDDLSLDGVEFQSIQPTPQQNNVAQDQSQQYQSEPYPNDPLSEPPLMEEPPVMQDDGYQNNQYDQYEQYDQPMGGNSVPPGHPDYDYAPPLEDTRLNDDEPMFFDEGDYERSSYPNYENEQSIIPENTFDLSAVTVNDLAELDPVLIGKVFDALEQRDPASQLEFFADIGLDLQNDDDLKFIADLNKIQTKNALDQGLGNIAENNSSLPVEDRVYTTADSKLFLSDNDPDFLLSKEENPFEVVQVAEKTLFNFETKSFITQPYYGLSLKGATKENALNFLSNRQFAIEGLINQNQVVREAKQQIYNEVTGAPNTYFSGELTDKNQINALMRQVRDFCLIRGIEAEELGLVPKSIVMDQWRVNSDHTAARLEQLEIHYLEFNTDTLTKEVIQLLETREHSDQLQAALLLKEHKENQKTKETVKEDVESADPNAPKGTPKSTLNIAGGPQDKASLAASSVASKSFKDMRNEEGNERPPLARENSHGHPRTVADELAALSAKMIAVMIELVKKTIKLIIAAIMAMFNKNKSLDNLKNIWDKPINPDVTVKSNHPDAQQPEQLANTADKSKLTEPGKNADILKPISKEQMLPLLNDPYTTQLNKDRDGVTLEEFDLNVGKVYAIDGEQYIVIDVVGKDSVEGIESSTPFIKLVKEADLPPQVEGSDAPTPITPFYLETIEDKVTFLSIEELHEGIKSEKIHEFEGRFFEPICSQYLEQARMFLGAEYPLGQDPEQMTEEAKASYKDQFIQRAYQSGQMISDQVKKAKSKLSNLLGKFKGNTAEQSATQSAPQSQDQNNDGKPMNPYDSIYVDHDSDLEAFFNDRHNNVSYAEIEQFVGMVYEDETTQTNMVVLDIASDNLDKRAIVVPLSVIENLENITEKDVLYFKDIVNESSTVPLYELESVEPIDELNALGKFSSEYLDKLKADTINNTAEQTNTYARSAERELELSKMILEGKLSVVGAMVKTDYGQFVVLTSDSEGHKSIAPEYNAVAITNLDRQITTEDIINAGITTIPRKDILEWNTVTALNEESANQVTYLDPEVYQAVSNAIHQNREKELIQTLSTLQPSAALNSIGSKIITQDGNTYIGLCAKDDGKSGEYYAVKAPDNQLSPIGASYINDVGVEVISRSQIAEFQNAENNQQQLISHDVFVTLLNAVNNSNEQEVLHLFSNLDQVKQQIKDSLFSEKESEKVIEQNQFIEQLKNNNLVKADHINALNQIADQIQNTQLKNVVKGMASTVVAPENSQNEMYVQSFLHLNQRLDTLQQDLKLQAASNLMNAEYKQLFECMDDHLVLPTAYGDAKFVNLNSVEPRIVEFRNSAETGQIFDSFNAVIAETGNVEIALQHLKQEILTDHYIAAIHEDVKLHRLEQQDMDKIKEVNQILEADFDKTGLRLEALQDGLNFNTKNYLDQVKLEKNTTSQFLSDLDKHIDLELARRNDHDNNQTLGR